MADKEKKNLSKSKAFDQENEIKKLSLFVTVVNNGQASAIIRLFQQIGCSVSFVYSGQGTAQREILSILGIADNKKEVVCSLVKQELIPDIKREVEAFFLAARRNRGIGFSIPLTTVAGVRVYQFLTNS